MKLNERQVQIINEMYNRNQHLVGTPEKPATETMRRELTLRIAQQIRFEFGEDWGTKSTTNAHPQSQDAIAFRLNSQSLEVWDWQNGTTLKPQVHVGQEGEVVNHFFIDVFPVNHLGAAQPDEGGTDETDDDITKELVAVLKALSDAVQATNERLNVQNSWLSQIADDVKKVMNRTNQITDDVRNILNRTTTPLSEYETRIFGATVISKPRG